VIHTCSSLPTGLPATVHIANFCLIQPNCTLYSCFLDEEVVVGHQSVVLEGARLEKNCVIGPNSVVPPGRVIPSGQLWAGNPVQ
jgi:carbonic anhydrase/acetyltransferase-like protein (isoleucine patch superfamily)